jgi:hypothetical protein
MPDAIATSSEDAPLPPVPGLSAGARVAAHLMHGEVLEGRLESFSDRNGLRLARAGGVAAEIPLSRVRYVVVFDRPRVPQTAYPGEPQRFALTYVDGKEIAGLAYGLTAGPEGLQLYGRDAKAPTCTPPWH